LKHRQKHLSACLIAMAALFSTASIQGAFAAVAPSLGTASTFGALGGAGVTCDTPPALPAITATGDVGSPGTAPTLVTGFPPPLPSLCSLSGTVQLGATTAFGDFMTAYNTLASNLPADGYQCPSADTTHNLSGDLVGMTLSPGVYCISGVGLLTGQLTLDLTANGGGDGSAVWIFKGDSSITPIGSAALRSTVVMAHGGQACNVYWQLATAATFSLTDFVGNVLAGTGITFTGSSLAGRALANTAVTMTGTSIIGSEGCHPGYLLNPFGS
jgi:hypothetical protein